MSMRLLFHFFKILIFWVVSGMKGQKMTQNDKTLSFVLHISGAIHYVSFMVHMCKMISPQILVFFQNFDFLSCQISKRAKNGQKCQIICLSHSISQEPYIIRSSFVVHKCKMMSYRGFFYFFKNLIFQVNKLKFFPEHVCLKL